MKRADLQAPQTRENFKAFLVALEQTSPESYRKRYGDDVPDIDENVEFAAAANALLLASRDGKIVGAADYVEDISFSSGTVAAVNAVLLDQYQGKGIGKALIYAIASDIRDKGYKYIISGVRSDNNSVIKIMNDAGHREMSDSHPGKYFRYFWMALDPDLSNTEPRQCDD